jgi:hypothetical protein
MLILTLGHRWTISYPNFLTLNEPQEKKERRMEKKLAGNEDDIDALLAK